jgi:hypothetical protein
MKTNDVDISEDSQRVSPAGVLKHAAQRELAAGVLKQAAQRLRVNRSRPSVPARPRHREQALVAPYQKRRFHRPRRRHDPMLVLNMSIFNSLPQRENAWS